ncbi:MAG: type III secretion system export apparatus subunit SctS [Deltaproteobacteria bacterium]|jgi:type III secretion protein S|nr:type III secretion system export apparatus subunit SctS [Deltaproteobacteria bacterium]
MNSGIDLALQACYLVLMLSLPPIAVASLAGLLVSLFQAITQLQEQTLSFGIKLVCVVATILLMSNWLGGELMAFSRHIFGEFYLIVK